MFFPSRIAKSTSYNHVIGPRLFKTPSSNQNNGESKGLDFFLADNLRFGITVLVNGDNSSEYLERFTESGKYSLFRAQDFVVIDVRPGPVSNVQHHPKRITVFLDVDTLSCNCVFSFG